MLKRDRYRPYITAVEPGMGTALSAALLIPRMHVVRRMKVMTEGVVQRADTAGTVIIITTTRAREAAAVVVVVVLTGCGRD